MKHDPYQGEGGKEGGNGKKHHSTASRVLVRATAILEAKSSIKRVPCLCDGLTLYHMPSAIGWEQPAGEQPQQESGGRSSGP